jgi:hypothetical protein
LDGGCRTCLNRPEACVAPDRRLPSSARRGHRVGGPASTSADSRYQHRVTANRT